MAERGQVYTLEGIFAGLIILLGLFFAIQATTTSPSAAGASNPHAIQDDDIYVEDVLSSMNRSTLRRAVLFWDNDGFHCSAGRDYYTGFWDASSGSDCAGFTPRLNTEYPPPNRFGALLEQRLGGQYSYNVRVAYEDQSGTIQYQRMVYQGEPGVGAVRSSTSVVLSNNDELRDATGAPTGTTLREDWQGNQDFFAPPPDGAADNADPYNVVHVEVVIWRG